MMNTLRHRYFILAIGLILAGFGIFSISPARAATLSISSGTISIDTAGQRINAIEVHLTFDPQKMLIENLNTGGSVVNFWVQSPTVSNRAGTIDLSGIIPGGLTTAKGTIVSFNAVSLQPGAVAQFNIVSAQALLNDGKGTPAALSIANASFIPLAAATSSPSLNTSPPDPFLPQIGRDPGIFGGDYFVAFAATDPQSGIDHYEILEGSDTVWHTATSPYRLTDQSLSSNIYIRAVDGAGNFRVVELPAENKPTSGMMSAGRGWLEAVLGLIVLLLIVLVVAWCIWKWKKYRRG
jgi:hypothetical protein